MVSQMTAPPRVPACDADLIGRSFDDPEAFAALFDRYSAMLYRYVSRRLGAEAAEDVVGETFLVAFSKRHRYDLAQPDARPWLFGIATKLLANDRRSEQRRLDSIGRLGGDIRRATGLPDSERDLATALAKLDPAQRDVLLLHAWCDLQYEEIAGALEIPVGTVRSRLSRARASLQAELDGAPPAPLPLSKQREVS
jgi:RNA polymerase sigma-70 factor (ECF subfamily)